MATDIRVSELNEITINNDLNHIIVNDRESANDTGITKKIQMCNILTNNIVKENNIINSAVTRNKVADLAIDCSKIAGKTITCNQIANGTINNDLLGSNSINNRTLDNTDGYTMRCLIADNGPIKITHPFDGCIAVESGITKLNTQTYYWPAGQQANKFLMTNGIGQLSWQDAVPGDSTSLVFKEIFPVGTIVPWAGTGSVPDDKWLPCDGSMFNGSDYPELSAVLLDIWGPRNTSNGTFFLPNLNGRVPIGNNSGTDQNGTSCTFTFKTDGTSNLGGEFSHRLTSQESGLPSHRHQLGIPRDSYGSANNYALVTTANSDEAVLFEHFSDYQSADALQLHNNMQPYTVVKYIIKAKPDDVEQFNPTVGQGLSARDANGQTSTITLTSTEIGLNVSNSFIFDNNRLAINPSLTATSIKFSNGTHQTVAPTISGVSEGLVGDGTGALHTLYEVDHGLGRTPTLTQFFWKCKSTANGKNYGYEVGTELYITSQSDSGLGHITAAAGPTKIYYRNGWEKMVYAKTTGTYINSNFKPANNTDNWELRYRVFA